MTNNFLNTILEVSAVVHFCTTGFPWLGGYCVLISLFFSSYWYGALLYLAWWIYDKDTPYRCGRRSAWVQNWRIWRYLASYFPIKLHKTADLDPSKNYIFAFHPHGLVPYGCFANFATNATGFDKLFPGITPHVLVINPHFMAPFYREYAIATGVGSVSAHSIDFKLTQIGPGHSVVIAVGGSAEIMLTCEKGYTLKIKRRNGFVRRALKNGAYLVPVFSFNEHRVFEVPIPRKGSLLDYFYRLLKWLNSVLSSSNSFIPIVISGRWRWLGTVVPRNIPINTVIGAPVDFTHLKYFKKGEDVTEELVNEYHQAYLEALRKLYNDNKSRFNEQNTPLIFV